MSALRGYSRRVIENMRIKEKTDWVDSRFFNAVIVFSAFIALVLILLLL